MSILILFICFCCFSNRHFTFGGVKTINPLNQVYGVLKFVKQHPIPLHRSALTFGEIPSRMDYAKDRYGGPFNTDQVESVKTFGALLLTVFGGFLEPQPTLTSPEQHLGKYFYENLANIHFLVLFFLTPLYTVFIRPLLFSHV